MMSRMSSRLSMWASPAWPRTLLATLGINWSGTGCRGPALALAPVCEGCDAARRPEPIKIPGLWTAGQNQSSRRCERRMWAVRSPSTWVTPSPPSPCPPPSECRSVSLYYSPCVLILTVHPDPPFTGREKPCNELCTHLTTHRDNPLLCKVTKTKAFTVWCRMLHVFILLKFSIHLCFTCSPRYLCPPRVPISQLTLLLHFATNITQQTQTTHHDMRGQLLVWLLYSHTIFCRQSQRPAHRATDNSLTLHLCQACRDVLWQRS